MKRSLYIKLGVILATTLICLYGIFGLPKSGKELTDNFNNNIKLGLDLRGGSQLVVQVQVQDAFKAEADQVIERIRDAMRTKGISYGSLDRNDPQSLADAEKIEILAKGVDSNRSGDFRTVCNEQAPSWSLTSMPGGDFRLNIKASEALGLRKQTVERSIATIEKRINGLGLSESTVQQRGRSDAEAEILIQLPGVDDPARIKQIIQSAALLEIHLVKDGPYQNMQQAMAANNGMLPVGTKLVETNGRGNNGQAAFYLLERVPAVTGRDLRSARAQMNQVKGGWETAFTLSQDGARRFERVTGQNIGKPLAIVLDKKIDSVATIQDKISDSGVITSPSQQEAQDRTLVLTSGSLPATVQYLEERSVGPSLGADSIRDGLMSGVVGLIAVILVMLVYYKKAGINATVALILNALILIAALAYFGAVLTLPGIAGIVLLIGMAVDSNVLIFERIREELAGGKSPAAAIEAGFGKAFLTILDTHVTTIVSCAFLFIFGTTQVKGFAVSLVIGLIANLFTAVFVSRVIFDWETFGKRVEKLSI